MSDEPENILASDELEAEVLAEGAVEASQKLGTNEYFRTMLDRNFIEYASYAIKDRAIPNVDDGLKPVQRRILWAMHKVDDNRTNKAAFVVGEVMGKYHPHGDASIKDALVVLANKEYFIEKQGNFGNIFTGSCAAAARYIECGLTPMAREVLYNDDITELVDTYDGRNMEPVLLPVKIPALLMLGSDGIAVGMATKIMPHNFNELLQAQIAALNGDPFELYPDFPQGGLMDVREYADGNGKITLRAKIDIVDRKLIIREIPATTTTESLIASIEKAAERNKIKISSVNDYTAQNVEIEVVPTRGYDVEKALQALYMYTDCSVSISPNLTVIRDFRPAVMTVTEVIYRNTEKLLEYLRRELEIALEKQSELFHAKTLAQIFFENRIYKRIEECKSEAEEYEEVHSGLAPFRFMLRRDVTNADVDKLLALPVRRIARFDIEKNQRELREIEQKISVLLDNLRHLKRYATNYLNELLKKYGHLFPRRTEIESLNKIDRKSAALNNIKIGWDRRNGYIGTGIKSDDTITCNEFDLLLQLDRVGKYKITALPPDKLFVGKLYDCRKFDPQQEFGIVYRDNKSGKCYGKRSVIGSFIKDREYSLCPDECKLELFTPRADAIYLVGSGSKRTEDSELNLMELPLRSAKARGILIGNGKVAKLTHSRYLTPEEVEVLRATAHPEEKSDDPEEPEVTEGAEELSEPGEDAARKRARRFRNNSRIPSEIALAQEAADLLAARMDRRETPPPPEPAEPAESVETAKPAEASVQSVEASVQSVEPVESVEASVESVEASVESVEASVESVAKPAEPVESAKSVESVEPVESAEPAKLVETVAPARTPETVPVTESAPVAEAMPVAETAEPEIDDEDIPPFDPDPQFNPPPVKRETKPVAPRTPPAEELLLDAPLSKLEPPRPRFPRVVKPIDKGDDDSEDELGIVQPEFGF